MLPHQRARITTGFVRPGRSFYLDDMVVSPGDTVVCKADITGQGFTPGHPYRVLPDGALLDNFGQAVRPSARFCYAA